MRGHLQNLPKVSEDEINEQSNRDLFSKTIAIVQILWNALQVLVRTIRGLAISQLEVAVLAFSLCAVPIYILQWNRPKDVQVPVTLIQYPGAIPGQILHELSADSFEDTKAFGHLSVVLSVPSFLRNLSPLCCRPVANDTCWVELNNKSTVSRATHSGILVGAIIFGAIHLLAWNFEFPTQVERTIWRAASLASIIGPVVTYSLTLLPILIPCDSGYCCIPPWLWKNEFVWIGDCSVFPVCVLYIISRLFILVEIFRTLFYLPTDAYLSTWVEDIPHVI